MESRDEIIERLERIEQSVHTEEVKGVKKVIKSTTDDVQVVVKEELIKSLFATSLADGVREVLRLLVEIIAVFFVAHVTLSILTSFVLVAIITALILVLRKKRG